MELIKVTATSRITAATRTKTITEISLTAKSGKCKWDANRTLLVFNKMRLRKYAKKSSKGDRLWDAAHSNGYWD